jgi:hypothetical protein
MSSEHQEGIQHELEALGRQTVVLRIRAASRRVFAELADESLINPLDDVSRRFVESVARVAERGLKLSDQSNAELERFAGEVAWVTLAADIVSGVMAHANDGGGGGSGEESCQSNCQKTYNECLKAAHCGEPGSPEICGTACELNRAGCLATCVITGKGTFGGGIIIA